MSARDIWRIRRSIFKALRIDPREPTAAYAIARFTVLELDGKTWIAGAVSPAPDVPTRYGDWHANGGETILWNPRSNDVQLYGCDEPSLIMPHEEQDRLTVYADGFAFFRAWADNRAALDARASASSENHRIVTPEPTDGGIPGALAIGALHHIDWFATGAAVLVAGLGIDPKKLNSAIIRSARLPRVESLAA